MSWPYTARYKLSTAVISRRFLVFISIPRRHPALHNLHFATWSCSCTASTVYIQSLIGEKDFSVACLNVLFFFFYFFKGKGWPCLNYFLFFFFLFFSKIKFSGRRLIITRGINPTTLLGSMSIMYMNFVVCPRHDFKLWRLVQYFFNGYRVNE